MITFDVTIRDGLLVDPAHDTPSGVLWEAPEFTSPWWEYPPPVEPIMLSRVGWRDRARLLECPVLWSPVVQDIADADNDDENLSDRRHRLPQNVRDTIEVTIRDGLLVNPAHDTPSGVWLEAPEFAFPWWKYPPPVDPIML